MKNRQEQNWHTAEGDALDRQLDALLAKFADAEPRRGLEDRILANLRAEQANAHRRPRWRWVVAAVAAVVLVIAGESWRTAASHAPVITQRAPAIAPGVELPAQQVASSRRTHSYSTPKSVRLQSRSSTPVNPKLDQFPSPQPLSEQEKILASYVEANPQHAVLLARARAEEFHRDQIEETRSNSASNAAADFDIENEDRTGNK